ncbi:putative N6-adenine-specific DNA methylase [Thioflavicoccus mobilis 8321]|uniref:Ribosomal RNA large subunit methyltransferase K/L n=1 Tax=Thioflavicoccus mobilis 8321 TaxID=765912 RepID=L0GUQ2_9GAMM|nr:bifunctional 23S rRNA (guanine(2069)-N(7))-methyltransferase RlmK/23S rRNA (guanine(2445)-N(2))-methyltransferase RlmL [Thioflavicoccus mobilis]AGA89552.1 putative N6-adenine-specific DNA methylase [Thioflavicoccus mobilis 8321]
MSDLACFATAPKYLESLLADELRGLGIATARETRGGVAFTATLAEAYRVCLWSRVANRVLVTLTRFPAPTPETLYEGAAAFPWEEHLTPERTFAVHLDRIQSQIGDSRYGALKVKDAIADRFRQRYGRRPSVAPERPDVQVHVYLHRDEATLSLDLAGESLHRRGYREQGAAAPLKENLAAAILLRAGWPAIAAAGGNLVDPLCGSGTLPIEAALIAADSAPGLLRTYWGLLGWRQHDPRTWQALLDEAAERRQTGLAGLGRLRGYDRDAGAIRAALANLARAGLAGHVHFERRELAEAAPGRDGEQGLIVANPPYGERLGEAAELPAFYALLGARLRERFDGWQAAVLTGNPELGKAMGLRAHRQHRLMNGPLDCRLLHFQVGPEAYVSNRPRPLPAAERGPGAEMFANRLAKNLKALAKWRRREQVDCFRCYDADLPEYALAVDVYEAERRWVHVQEYEAPTTIDPRAARRRLREALGVLPEVLEVPDEQILFKVRRQQRGMAQYERVAQHGHFLTVQENGLRFLVNLEDYLDTGLFLDHRDVRRLVGELAPGRHVLNLFGYTGTATCYAARGGALSTTTVDLSNTYLEWAGRNLALNGFRGPQHRLIQTDCLQWLAAREPPLGYDLIFLDPPSFSTSKRMQETLDVQRDHVALIRTTLARLAPGGILIFSTNRRRFRFDAEALADLHCADITAATLPRDFTRNPRIHQCWRIERR